MGGNGFAEKGVIVCQRRACVKPKWMQNPLGYNAGLLGADAVANTLFAALCRNGANKC
jgi:hypothetical protein